VAEFTEYAHGTPCWTDVTSPDLERTHAFYGALFGWQAETDPRPEAGGYTMYTLRGKSVAAASPPPPGTEGVPPHWTTYLASDDVDATASRIREAGGSVLIEPFDVLDAGRMAVAQDPQGAGFGIWQAGAHVGAGLANEPGTLNWNEVHSADPAGAAAFYAEVFGMEVEESDTGGPEPYRVLKVQGRGVAGSFRLQEGEPPNWMTVFTVADVDATAALARELGGSVLAEPFEIPDVGRFAVLQDPVGAVFGVIA
jgi:predicted enzyme related to lactoylglutathione lyase